jgi:hypothetical protein
VLTLSNIEHDTFQYSRCAFILNLIRSFAIHFQCPLEFYRSTQICGIASQHSYYAEKSRTDICILITENKTLSNYTKLGVPYIKQLSVLKKNPRDYAKNSKIFPHSA